MKTRRRIKHPQIKTDDVAVVSDDQIKCQIWRVTCRTDKLTSLAEKLSVWLRPKLLWVQIWLQSLDKCSYGFWKLSLSTNCNYLELEKHNILSNI